MGACALLSVAACAKYSEDEPVDRTLRVILSPSPDTFQANGKTAAGESEYTGIVKVLEGTSLSSQSWTAEIVDEPSWIDFTNRMDFINEFTDIYSGKKYTTSESGIAFSLKSNKGNSRTFLLRITLGNGEVFDFKIKQRGEIPDAVHITSMDDFNAWLETQSEWSSADEVYLETDLDMDGIEWTPINYPGKFDGQGHCIYNFVQVVNSANFGFFGTISGPLSNVVFGSKDGKTYDGVSAIKFDGSGGVFWVGIISNAQADITSVKNFVNLEIASTCNANLYAAPFIGAATVADITIKDCENYGNLTASNADKTDAKETLYGGILARCNPGGASSLNIIGCKNYGDLITMDPFTTAIGGIVGNCPSANLVYVENCENFGNVANNSTAVPDGYKEGYAGGIAGLLNGNQTVGTIIKGCVNHADLLASGRSLGDYGGIAGRIPSGDIIDCVNEGNVTFDNPGPTGQNLLIGGITGGLYKGGNITGCTNKGNISTNKNSVNRVGGIVSTMNSNTVSVKNCTNEGSVTMSRNDANGNWQAAGGICGFQETSDAASITGCTNKGAVTVSLPSTTSHANQISAGGIIGLAVRVMTTSGNVNLGDVKTSISGSVANYAGGIFGWFKDGSSTNDQCTCAVSGKTAGAAAGNNQATISGPAVSGSVNGTTLTAANIGNLVAGANTGSISGAKLR